jgi:PHP family Zn ribbon phosphoesterase
MEMNRPHGLSRGQGSSVSAAWLSHLRSTLPRYQTRMCARCGTNTTFVLEDAVGDWYSCVECGRSA